MGRIARWIRSQIDKYIIGVVESRLNTTIQAFLYGSPGDDSPPLPEDRVLIIKIDGSGKYAIAGTLVLSQGAEPGERKLYSRDNEGNLKSLIYLKNDGTMELNGNTDFAVRFTILESGFNQLKDDFNATLLHVHPVTTAPGSTGPPTPLITPSTANIAGAKIEEIKVS